MSLPAIGFLPSPFLGFQNSVLLDFRLQSPFWCNRASWILIFFCIWHEIKIQIHNHEDKDKDPIQISSRKLRHLQWLLAGCEYCLSTIYEKQILVLNHFILQLPIFAVTGVFYAKVIIALKKGAKNNTRKRTLSIAFFGLWLSWALCTGPFAIYEIWKYFIFEVNGRKLNTYYDFTTFYNVIDLGDWLAIFYFRGPLQNHANKYFYNLLSELNRVRPKFRWTAKTLTCESQLKNWERPLKRKINHRESNPRLPSIQLNTLPLRHLFNDDEQVSKSIYTWDYEA